MDNINVMLKEAVHKPENTPPRTSAAREKTDYLSILSIFAEMNFSFIECIEARHARTYLTYDIASDNGYPGGLFVFLHQSPEL